MKKLILAASAAIAALTAPVAAETAQERGEARLTEMLEGRVAGEPQSCITTFRPNELRVVEHVGLVYDSGDTVWVGRAVNPRSLDRFDIPVIRRHSSQLCRSDTMHTIDPATGMFTGVIFIEQFVPYTKPENG